ncbi:hypothetical protein AGMMS50239_36740 [Bacteroidia bacterium]|nr:hypothetical protein AGMMS50239_36740 [Bacteroidia bacterium]
MTNIQLVKHLMVELDKQGLGFGQAFINEELDHFLNTAYLSLIEQKLVKMEMAENDGVQTKYRDDLNFLNILVFNGIIDSSNINSYLYPKEGYNALYITPTTEPLHAYHASISFNGHGSFVCSKIKSSDRKPFVWNDLNLAYVENPVYFMLKDSTKSDLPSFIFLVDPDMVNVTMTVAIYGIKRPALIDSTTNPGVEIEVPWWNEIVQRAATFALENIESTRTASHLEVDAKLNP